MKVWIFPNVMDNKQDKHWLEVFYMTWVGGQQWLKDKKLPWFSLAQAWGLK